MKIPIERLDIVVHVSGEGFTLFCRELFKSRCEIRQEIISKTFNFDLHRRPPKESSSKISSAAYRRLTEAI